MRERYDLERLIVTRGSEGAILVDRTGILQGEPVPVDTLVDTVGAGDAFTAVHLLGLARDWPLPLTLQRALAFASAICALHGAVTDDPAFYHAILKEWS